MPYLGFHSVYNNITVTMHYGHNNSIIHALLTDYVIWPCPLLSPNLFINCQQMCPVPNLFSSPNCVLVPNLFRQQLRLCPTLCSCQKLCPCPNLCQPLIMSMSSIVSLSQTVSMSKYVSMFQYVSMSKTVSMFKTVIISQLCPFVHV